MKIRIFLRPMLGCPAAPRGFPPQGTGTVSYTHLDVYKRQVHGLGNVRQLLEALRRKEVHYDFVEVMACPGGCVGGGGQPIHDGEEYAARRAPVLYEYDRRMSIRFSHENPQILKLYEEFLGKPRSETAHHLLHVERTV